jgi:hypothetical protein
MSPNDALVTESLIVDRPNPPSPLLRLPEPDEDGRVVKDLRPDTDGLSTTDGPAVSPGALTTPAPGMKPPVRVAEAVAMYAQGETLAMIAAELESEARELVVALSAVLFDLDLTREDGDQAARHGHPYEAGERDRMVAAFADGRAVLEIAEQLERTPLAVAWQLLDSPARPVTVPRRVLRRLEDERSEAVVADARPSARKSG